MNYDDLIEIQGFKFKSFFEGIFYIYQNLFLKENYLYEVTKIPYICEKGNQRTYIIDFTSHDNKSFVDIKTVSNLNIKNNTEEWCKNNGYEYYVITEDDISGMFNAMILSGYIHEFFYEFVKKYPHMLKEEIKKNINLNEVKVKTPNGFSKFSGIKRVKADIGLVIEFVDNTYLTCTFGHKLKMKNGFMDACDILEGDEVSGKIVKSISETTENVFYYDLLGVEGEEYYTNGVISHNCAFLENWNEFWLSVYPTISSGKETKVLISSCVTKDTLVWDKKRGLVEVAEFIKDNSFEHPNFGYEIDEYSVYGKKGYNTGNIMVNSGNSIVRHIKSNHAELKCSIEHKLWSCKNGEYDWFKSKDLNVGDYICINTPSDDLWINDDFIPELNRTITNSEAFEMGQFISGKKIKFTEFYEYLGLSQGKEIPSRLTRFSKNILMNIIFGIFHEKNNLKSKSEKLINQIRIILNNFGILSVKSKIKEYFILALQQDIKSEFKSAAVNGTMIWEKIKTIEEYQDRVYDFSLNHIENDDWCHSVIYNGVLGHQTPKGLNHFYKICSDAQDCKDGNNIGSNGFIYKEVRWDSVPGRDEKWKESEIAVMNGNVEQFNQEYNCSFEGSTDNLINSETLGSLVSKKPILSASGLYQYEKPLPNHVYTLIADVSRGKGLDYSAFSIIDVTNMPYKQVCVYNNNEISPVDYATIIHTIAKTYNEAMVLVEINDIGGQVADILALDFGYENVLSTQGKNGGRGGKKISSGFGRNNDRGIRTTTTVKKIGCSILKLLVEQKQLLINDETTIYQIKRFVKKGESFEAEKGHNDDLVMTLVLFAWMADQNYFKEMTDINTLRRLRDNTDEEIDNMSLPFFFSGDYDSNYSSWEIIE